MPGKDCHYFRFAINRHYPGFFVLCAGRRSYPGIDRHGLGQGVLPTTFRPYKYRLYQAEGRGEQVISELLLKDSLKAGDTIICYGNIEAVKKLFPPEANHRHDILNHSYLY